MKTTGLLALVAGELALFVFLVHTLYSRAQRTPESPVPVAKTEAPAPPATLTLGKEYALTLAVNFFPDRNSDRKRVLFEGARIKPVELVEDGGSQWYKVEFENEQLWIPSNELRSLKVEPYEAKAKRDAEQKAGLEAAQQARREGKKQAEREALEQTSRAFEEAQAAKEQAEKAATPAPAAPEAPFGGHVRVMVSDEPRVVQQRMPDGSTRTGIETHREEVIRYKD